MKRFTLFTSFLCVPFFIFQGQAQKDVTSKIDNPNFEARFAGWENNGMSFQTNANFQGKDGMVYMEKYVSKGSRVGTASITQRLVDLEPGTYTLVANAHNIQQDKTDTKQTDAVLLAGNETTEVNDSATYRVTFTVVDGQAEIGFKATAASGNWICVDHFRLYYNGIVKDSINMEMQKLIEEAEGIIGDGNTAPALQTAIDKAKALTDDEDIVLTAQELIRATLNYRISNATGTAPKVSTYSFVPTGVTIALGRSTVTGTNIKERGFCWSTEPEPTVLDNRTTRYFSNNGNIYCLEHLKPATIYYVRAYAMTTNYQVAYGDVVKIATLPEGNVTTDYDYKGDEQTNFRIASAVEEVKWLYNNLSNIRGFHLSVHYVPGAGAGNGTADCSYGGWMRVSQNVPYQQTGTILHETNHGVGVGTTNEWYNNGNLRANVSRGDWLGPRANQVIKFLENNENAVLTGDNTHMWPYGINGAHEDIYNPESTILYYGNIFTTHALHQDGLPCTSSVGFATPAYVFEQDDNRKYYITSEDGGNTGFLTITTTGLLRTQTFNADEADNFAWHITYDPQTSLYIFQNVGTGKYMTYSNNSIRTASKTSLATTEKFLLLPARQDVTMGTFTTTGYWLTKSKSIALQAGTTNTTTTSLNFANSATNQRWLFLTEEQMGDYNREAIKAEMERLDALIASVRTLAQTPHTAKDENTDVDEVDATLAALLDGIEQAKTGYTTAAEVTAAVTEVENAMLSFLSNVSPQHISQPFDLTFILVNPGLDKDSEGWSTTAANSYSCCEFYETTFDFNQTTTLKMPAGTYELRVQAFQRPGSASNTYSDFVTNGTNNVNAQIYLKTKYQKIKNIWEDAQSRSLGGGTSNAGGRYVPNNMEAASKWFANGWYENSALLKTTTVATMKLGIRCTSVSSSYWTIFDNFRLYYYGGISTDDVTGIDAVSPLSMGSANAIYDLSGRRVTHQQPLSKGIYIQGGKKVFVK